MEDAQLLRLQAQHRSSIISNKVLHCRHQHPRLPGEFMFGLLKLTGFYMVSITQGCNIDTALITALVERWRPETHTFHFPCGEATVTLEDVVLQVGLNVNGLAVTGPTRFDWQALCAELLGRVPEPTDMRGSEVKLTWLVDNFYETPPDATELQKEQFCRAHILNMIGSVVMPDKSDSRVHLMYLPLLRDLHLINKFSWGSACLAHLYRELCRASKLTARSMGGCLALLQSWAWFRIPFIAPICSGNSVFPVARRWTYYNNVDHSAYPHGNLTAIRSLIDHMDIKEFVWKPYASLMHRLPSYVIQNAALYRANVPLICFSTVVWHPVDRVKLQFGFIQEVPQVPINMDKIHKVDKRGNVDVNWEDRHAEWIGMWGNRHNSIMDGQNIIGEPIHNEEYLRWFWTHSKIFLSSDQLLTDPRSRYMPDVIQPQSVPIDGESSQQINANPLLIEAGRLTPEYTPGETSYSEFCTNLFGVNVGTPKSADAYIQHLTSYQQSDDAPGHSGVMHDDEPQQVADEPQPAEEQVRPEERRRYPQRKPNRPPCGTGGCL